MSGAAPFLDRLIGAAASWRWPHPLTAALGRPRERALRAARARYLPRVRPLWEPLARGEPGAEAAFDRVLLEAVPWLRARAAAEAGPVLGRLEAALHREGAERIDDPRFPRPARERVVALIDRISRVQGTYAALAREVAPLLERAGPRPRLLDVAGGAGGFACFLAERGGGALELESSDRCADYVALGQARARRQGLPVRFRTFDALDPRPGEAAAEVLTCLHALHHFAPGPAARLLSVCARSARVGAVVMDGERRLSTLLWTALGRAYVRDRDFQHDAMVSVRRLYVVQEVALLCALAPLPAGTRWQVGVTAPAHLYARLWRSAADPLAPGRSDVRPDY